MESFFFKLLFQNYPCMNGLHLRLSVVAVLPASSIQLEYCTSAIQCWESVQQPLVINQPHYLQDTFRVISS